MRRRLEASLTIFVAVAVTATGVAAAEESAPPTELGTFTILGSPERRADIPGSAHFLGPEQLERFEYADINRALRTVPGVYVQEE